jgi:hypothetical protein
MSKLLLAFALLFGAALPAAAQPRGVADPRAFVAATYARYQANPNVPPPDQSFAYSPRLKRLFDAYEAWTRRHEDLVGALDFDWWTNAQDYEIRNVRITELPVGPGRRWIVASFRNFDRQDAVRFLFVRRGWRWYLDDATHFAGRGGDGWTLSELLQRREE